MINKLQIKEFRKLSNVEIDIGDKVTVIAGQNGTCKSSILGLIGHVFNFDSKHRTVFDRSFTTKYSEVFSFSYPKYDKAKKHRCTAFFDYGEPVDIVSYDRYETDKEPTLRIRVGKSSKGGGKIEFPVLYLGLRRVFPLADEFESIKALETTFTDEESKLFKELHNSILISDEDVNIEHVGTNTKNTLGARTDKYDILGNSAGQDNIGQIISAIISFKRLKASMGNDYKGGILLIDELDATLYPAAQIQLIEYLYKYCGKLNLKIIFTTHSKDIIRKCLGGEYKYVTKVNFLSNATGLTKNYSSTDYELIKSDLDVIPYQKPVQKKVSLYCEDREARLFLNKLVGTTWTKKLNISKENFGEGLLKTLAEKKIPEFNDAIILLDGDSDIRRNKAKNLIKLPGDVSPERLMYNFLMNLPPDDEFWGELGGYTKQVFLRTSVNYNDREAMKKWFYEEMKYWGRGASRLFKRWIKENTDEVELFKKDMAGRVELILSSL